MSIEIIVPELGESIVEATIVRWLKHEGERVEVGEVVVELETEKVNLEVSAEQAGVLIRIKREEGEDVEIGDVLGFIDEAGEASSVSGVEAKQLQAEEKIEPTDNNSGQSKKVKAAETEKVKERAQPHDKKVTPMAKRLAQEYGVDLREVASSGADGRMTKEDVERYVEAQQAAKSKVSATPDDRKSDQKQAPKGDEPAKLEKRIRISRRRQTIARRLVEAQQTAAMLTTFNEIDMSAVINLRNRRQESFQAQHDIKLGFMSFFVKASIGALKQFPQLNAEIDNDEIVLKHYYDIGMAIGDEEGLVVPVIGEADRLTFAEIEQTISDYVQKVKDGSLSLQDLRGGTFTITNGGVFGSLLSTPILNLPQVGILGLHKIEKRPVVVDNDIVVRPMMYVALSYDHRIVDGREAVQFLVRIKTLIEDPEVLLLEG